MKRVSLTLGDTETVFAAARPAAIVQAQAFPGKLKQVINCSFLYQKAHANHA
jgi:hypothetical protein